MLKKIIIVLFCLLTTNLLIANSVTINNLPPDVTKSSITRVYSRDEVISLIEKISQQRSISDVIIKTIVNCESQYNTRALGDNGHSRGLVQIYDSYHPNITHEMAYDPVFAVNFLIDNLKAGRGSMWTCYNIYYGG